MISTDLIFWDFDGVIKDSVEVKAEAFGQLFQHCTVEVAERVRTHHKAHGGMSRFDKMPQYLEWAGKVSTPERVDEYCQRFAQLVFKGVVDAPWVPGVEAFLRCNPHGQVFVLVSATPQEELEKIIAVLNLYHCFAEVYGAPTSKRDAIYKVLTIRQIDARRCLMVGDARVDCDAANANHVPFLLRRHASNAQDFKHYTGCSVADFTDPSFLKWEFLR